MYNITKPYFDAKQAHKIPIVLCRIETQRTSYIFGRRFLNDDEIGSISGINLWDGSVYTGDGGTFGGLPVSYIENRVLNFGSIEKSLAVNTNNLPTSLSQAQIGSYYIPFDNVDGFFSRLFGDDQDEPFLAQTLKILQGYKGDAYEDFITIFKGRITKVSWNNKNCRIIAEDIINVFPEIISGESVIVYGVGLVVGKIDVEMGEETYTVSQMSKFFSSDSWLFNSNFVKTNIDETGIIFRIINTSLDNTLLEIGIDANNYPYIKTGQNVESAKSASESTYTSTVALTADDIASPLTLRVYFEDAGKSSSVTFTIAGASTVVSALNNYDDSVIEDNKIQLGVNFEGVIQNWIWNTSQYYWVNNISDNGLAAVPEIISGINITLTDGTWEVWPP